MRRSRWTNDQRSLLPDCDILTVKLTGVCIIIFCYTGQSVTSQLRQARPVKSSLYFNLTGIPDRLATTTFHRPQIYLLSYFIDFRQLHFGLHVKVNAGGCTHQYKLEVDSVFNVFTLRINFMHLRACILGDYPVPRHM